jgi:putative solute:sodium symporter small subunit
VDEKDRKAYWRSNLTLMAVLLSIWALVSFGAGIFFADALNEIEIIGFPLGFWFANQGSILVFLALIAVYVWRMDKLDEKFGIDIDDIDDYEGVEH